MRIFYSLFLIAVLMSQAPLAISNDKDKWPNQWNWPYTDFSKYSISASEFRAGGPLKDGIPSIDLPKFKPLDQVDYRPKEPVIALEVGGTAKAYPISVLMWHEIANDTIEGVPVAVTFCPLCNSAIVYERMIDGRETTFGVSGILRNSDLVMYDRASQSWWQQFTGRAIVGTHTGKHLRRLPAKLISFAQFKRSYPDGIVLVPNNPRDYNYGQNPYVNYDKNGRMFNVFVKLPKGFSRMERVVVVGDTAWRMTSIAKAGTILHGDIRMTWESGQVSALGDKTIGRGRDIGTVVAERQDENGNWQTVNYDVTFAFVFAAFKPDGIWRG